jgi:hypothetical protein
MFKDNYQLVFDYLREIRGLRVVSLISYTEENNRVIVVYSSGNNEGTEEVSYLDLLGYIYNQVKQL